MKVIPEFGSVVRVSEVIPVRPETLNALSNFCTKRIVKYWNRLAREMV